MRSYTRLSVGLTLAILLLPGFSAIGSTLDVPSVDYPTIQSAIDAASDGDTVMVAAGTYYERLRYDESLSTPPRSIALIGAGPGLTVVDAGGSGTCFLMVDVPATARVEGFTFTGGGNTTNGGGLYLANSHPTIAKNEITVNAAGVRGAGLYIYQSSPTVVNNTITANSSDLGAGVLAYLSSPMLADNTIESNTAGTAGAGVYLFSSTGSTLVNNVIAANEGRSSGGGVYIYNSNATLTNNTIADNILTASIIGGAGLLNNGGSSLVTNCIIWGNTGADDLTIDSGTPTVTYSDVGTGTPAGAGNISADPMFVGSGDYHLQAGSPCIDAGNNDAASLPDFDKDGNPRVSGTAVDMGAYEYQEPTNLPPVANGDGPYLGVEGSPVLMDGQASYDPEELPLTYSWDFGDGTTLVTTDAIVQHTYSAAGTYTVTLVVNDGELDSDPSTTQATIGTAGGGQSDDVNAFVTFASPAQRKTELPAGTTSFDVIIIYGPTIDASTFQATLNKQPFVGFNPVADTTETVTIPLGGSKNTLVLQVTGTRADGRPATDRDRLVFRVQ